MSSISPEAQASIAKIVGELDAMQHTYDTQLLALVMLSRSAVLFRLLCFLKIETEAQVCDYITVALENALAEPSETERKTPVYYGSQDISTRKQ